MTIVNKSNITTFTYKGKSIKLDIDEFFNKEWQEMLKPLFNTPYFSALMVYLHNFYTVNEVHSRTISPKKFTDVFAPFQYTIPSDIRAVLMLESPYYSTLSNGIGFGGGSEITNQTVKIHIEKFSKYTHNEQTIDPTLKDWCSQGVLILNRKPVVFEPVPNYHEGITDYFYANVISLLHELDSDLVVATCSTLANDLVTSLNIKDLHLVHSLSHFPILGSSIYNAINTQLIVNGVKPVVWSRNKE